MRILRTKLLLSQSRQIPQENFRHLSASLLHGPAQTKTFKPWLLTILAKESLFVYDILLAQEAGLYHLHAM
jgi:hypothetical protein